MIGVYEYSIHYLTEVAEALKRLLASELFTIGVGHWKNENGIAVTCISVFSKSKQVEETVDIVISIQKVEQTFKIDCDIVQSNGMIIEEIKSSILNNDQVQWNKYFAPIKKQIINSLIHTIFYYPEQYFVPTNR